jgi:hypothetical protein
MVSQRPFFPLAASFAEFVSRQVFDAGNSDTSWHLTEALTQYGSVHTAFFGFGALEAGSGALRPRPILRWLLTSNCHVLDSSL